MQFRPDNTELLADIASLLEDSVIEAVSGPLQHQVRVAANLARIVEREAELGPPAADRERERLVALVGNGDDLVGLRQRLCDHLMGPDTISGPELSSIYGALVSTIRDDLAISKPGYDAWEGV